MDWYPHEIDKYDADTLTLTLTEDGAYSRLLRWYYKHEKALPVDENELAAICRVNLEVWQQVAPKVLPYFVTRDSAVSHAHARDGGAVVTRLHNDKADSVLERQGKRRKKNAKRQRKHRKTGPNSDGDSNAPVTRLSRVTNTLEQSRAEQRDTKKEDRSRDVGTVLESTTANLTGKTGGNLSKEQRKAVWLSNICKEAQATMKPADYTQFMDGLANNDPRAKAKAEEINRTLKARTTA